MRIKLLLIALWAGILSTNAATWTTHFAYNDLQQLVVTDEEVIVLSGGHFYGLNKHTEQRHFYTLQDGFVSNNVSYLHYDPVRQNLLVFYNNGYLDVKNNHGIRSVSDFYLTQTTASKRVLSGTQEGDILYMGMQYGIQTLNLTTLAFTNTYRIGEEGSDVAVYNVVVIGDDIYAQTDSLILKGSLSNKPEDYRNWVALPHPEGVAPRGMANHNGQLVVLWGNYLCSLSGSEWQHVTEEPLTSLQVSGSHLLATRQAGGFTDFSSLYTVIGADRQPIEVAYDPQHADYWYADNTIGLMHSDATGEMIYTLNSPAENRPYRMYYQKDKLFVVPGGRWATENRYRGNLMMYEDGNWTNLTPQDLLWQHQQLKPEAIPMTDLMSVAADTADLSHFFLGCYGQGIFEFRNNTMVDHRDATNSALRDLSAVNPVYYTRVDGLTLDSENNLWIANEHILVRQAGQGWDSLLVFQLKDEAGVNHALNTPTPISLDEQRGEVWIGLCRAPAGLGLYRYSGTLENTNDDSTIFRSKFLNEDGSQLEFEYLYDCKKDLDGNVWLATTSGLYYKPATTDFFTDKTLLHLGVMAGDADWFLKDEVINCIAVDGQNRKWIGTSKLGAYLVSADLTRVEQHFTSGNSPMPSNNVLSIAINPENGHVMIGCADGLVEWDETFVPASVQDAYLDLETEDYSGMMNGWRFHSSYANVAELARVGGLIYGLASGSLCSLDAETEELRTHNALSGLSSSGIGHILSDGQGHLLIAYRDGNMDIMQASGAVTNLSDLKRKQLAGVSKLLHDAVMHQGKMYAAMDFGVLVLDLRQGVFSDWYLPTQGNYPMLEHVEIKGDSLYAASSTTLYTACLHDNLVDFAFWKSQPLSARPDVTFDTHILQQLTYNGCTYQAGGARGIVKVCGSVESAFMPNGPVLNMPYRMTATSDNRLFVVPGGRWTSQYMQDAAVMQYAAGEWTNISNQELLNVYSKYFVIRDFTRVAVDPTRPNHFAISSYGHGVFEFENNALVKVHNMDNSPLETTVSPSDPNSFHYVRTDGASYDKDGYLWVQNSGATQCLKVLSPEGKWTSLPLRNGGSNFVVSTPGDVLVDALRPNYRWVVSARNPSGIGLLDDGGTPMNASDDKSVFRQSVVDNRGKTLTPEFVLSIVQDRQGNILVGTTEGVFAIPASYDFFSSNRCIRPVIIRDDGVVHDDGTMLADYMLGTERINGMAVDGGNRVWFATAGSGAYLMEVNLMDDSKNKTVYHFTSANSPLPSDNVLSVAILPESGEVFFGTEDGLVSFRSDASEPWADYSSAYAFPNPVRPDYNGLLTITGLVEDSYVKIADAAGNTVYSCQSNGGMAIWDLKTNSGRRVAPGVYTIFCNAVGEDSQHTRLKVLIM